MDYNVVADVAQTCVLWNNTHDTYRGVMSHAWPVSSGRGSAVTSASPTTAATSPYSSLAFCCSMPDDGLNVGPQNWLTMAGQKRSCSLVSPNVARRCRIISPLELNFGRVGAETAIGNVIPTATLKVPTDPDVIMHPGNRGDGAV
jgi:hypothetical protein